MNRIYRNLLGYWAGGLLALLFVVDSTTRADDAKSNTIRVLTYNVQFLPGIASSKNERPNPEYRAARIAEEVSRFDIVGLQESFHDAHRGQIIDHLHERWNDNLQFFASPRPKGFLTGGGCLILSQLSLVNTGSMVYENFSKREDYGLRADGLAAKGVIHARLARDADSSADYLDLFVTHLEARDDDLRPLQYAELAAFVKSESDPDHPAIILGDMNTRGAKRFRSDPKSQYSQLTGQLHEARPKAELIDLWPHLMGDALGGTNKQESYDIGKRIDYILVINPPQPHAQLNPISTAVQLYQDSKVVALSDHNAVEAELEWFPPSELSGAP